MYYMTAQRIKDSVSRWANNRGFIALQEIGGIVDGILDVLLIPMDIQHLDKELQGHHWSSRLGLRGVEVKRSRADFMQGFKNQYQRYATDLQGLYLAVPKGMVSRKEIPDKYGILSISDNYDCSCVRHPQLNTGLQLTQEQMWMIVWKIKNIFDRQRRELNDEVINRTSKIERIGGQIIGAAVRKHRQLMDGQPQVTKEQESMIYVAGKWWEEQDFKQAITEMLKGNQK